MKVARLLGWLGMAVWFLGCAQRAPEPSAPAATAAPTSPTELQRKRADTPELPVAAPAPPAGPRGLDQAKADDEDLSTLEAAERALNQAKADLDRLALAEPAPAVGRNAELDRSAEKKASKPAARAPSAAGAGAAPKSNSLCEDACRAFSSLTRAANAVCRLDGNTGNHCGHAKQVLANAQQRVASCSCPAASD